MKKVFSLMFVLALLCTLFLVSPRNVGATIAPPTPQTPAEMWEWYATGVTGEEIPMYTITTTPRDWYKLMTNGLKVDGATQICHPFKQGRFGWTGEIFQLVEDAWVKLPTTVGWVPTEEGRYLACANVKEAGTYALFGYWVKPEGYVEQVPLSPCTRYSLYLGGGNPWSGLAGTFYDYPNSKITYRVIGYTAPFSGNLFGSTTSDAGGGFSFGSNSFSSSVISPSPAFTIHYETPGCYYDWSFGEGFFGSLF